MKRKKVILFLVLLLIAAVVVVPVHPKHGDRPFISHAESDKSFAEVFDLLDAYRNRELSSGAKMVQVNIDQLTGLDGYSLLGVESFFGHRSTTVVGYIKENDVAQFYYDGGAVWLGAAGFDALREIAQNSEQDAEP